MAANLYDAIVVGARCAGSPTAMLLARKNYKVLVVDRATFPSDTLSTHLVHPPGVAALQRWGLLERLIATGCPPIDTYSFDFGPFTLSGSPGSDAAPVAYGPRRTVLDAMLVDAASEAGAEVREGFTVDDVVIEDGRVTGVRGHGKGGRNVDAELCATALDETFSAVRSFDVAMAGYQTARDTHVLPMYEFTCGLATLAPPPPELQRLLAAAHGNQEAMDGFARVNAGVTSPADFLSEENAARIIAAAEARQ